ncbi:MAG: protein kinase, partial [Spirochaetes bacterium]|nr:protein kinase [Spirochaetota bacterium]
MELTFKQNEVIDQRYLIKKKIGEGGMSVVFQAKDKLKRKDVAVKFLKKGVTSSYVEDVIRFRREIEAVSKLDHPNIVKIYNSGEYKNTPFIVMELLIGDSLADLLDKAKEFGVKDSIQIISQLADALDYVHGKGILHRDLKPGNIMVSRTKNNINIKLLDFGVAFVMELGQIKGEEEVVGTFGYMSPEATGIVNKRIDERSDLYSLGVVFYRLLSGMLPFKGKEVSKLLHQQVAAIPSNLTRIRTGIAKELDEIVMKLLYKEQELRYQSTKGLLYDLKRYEKGERGFIIGEKDQKIKISYQTRLVGREGELHKIQKLYNQAKDANGMLCFISGESGVGKSRLVDEIRGYSYEAGGIFIGGRCLDQDNKIPYQPFRDAINAYIRFVEKLSPKQQEREIKRIKSILGDLGEIIIQLNANMGKLLGDVPPLVDLDPERENQRFIMVASRFFSNLGIDGRACILFLDDLQWADEGSLRMLAEIASNIKNKNLLILGTYRDDEVGEDHPLSKILKQMKNKNNPLDMIGLSPFSLDRLNNLIATLLGEEKEKAFSLTKYVFEKSSGNPFFAINIIRDMVEEKALVWKKGYWEEDWKKIEKLPVSISMIDIILKRIKDLPKDLNKLLCFGAVVGREFDIGLLYKLLPSLDQENIVGLVDQGGELQLLEKSLERGRILFVHDRIRDAFYNKIGIKERKALHLEIANALEQIYNKDPQSVIFDLVHHFSEGGDREKSLLYVLPAADKAKKNYANEEAIKYYKLGISLLEKSKKERSEEWMSAKDGLIDVYLTTGNSDEAITLSKEILPLKRKPLDKARIYRKLGQAWFKKGGYKQGEENLTKGLTLLGEIVPQTKPAIILSIIKGFILRGFSGIWMKIPAFGKAKVLSPEYFEIIRIYLPLGWMYIFTDILKCANTILMGANFVEYKMGRTKEFKNIKEHGLTVAGYAALYISIPMFKTAFKGFNKAFRIRKKMKDEWGIAQNLQWMGITYTWKGDHKKALDMLAQSDAMFRRIGDMWELGMVLTAIGRNNRYIADYKNAILAYNEYFDIGERTGNDHAVSEGQICLSYCYTEKGDFERAEHLIKKGKAVCEEHNNGFLICYAFLYYGFLELERENYLKAVSHFERARKVYEENAFLKDYTVYLYNYLTEAYIESYRIRFPKLNAQKRKEFLKKIRRSFRGLLRRTRPWINHYGSTLRVAGKYYSLMSQPGKARSSFKKSIQHHELSGRRYEL